MRKFLATLAFGAALIVFNSGCTKKSAETPQQDSEAARPKVVNLAIWSNYLSPRLIQEFEGKTGIKVQISNYSSNEELLAKLQAGATGYDVAVPSDYMVSVMANMGLIQELDYFKLPNAKNLDPKLLKKNYDPENKFSVPYDWGTTGIAINRSLYKGRLTGWKDLFETAELKGKFTLLDDVRETMGAALKSLGYSLNSKNDGELKMAKELLTQVRSRVKGFTSEPMMPLVNGETAVAHAYSSDALQARRESSGKIEYIIPVEGATLWIDNLVIPKGAPSTLAAHIFINFLLDAKSNASTVQAVLVAPANKETFALLPKDIQSNPALFPPDEIKNKLEMLHDLGDGLAAWDRIWTEVKASGN
jgi:spermidine/putrescine transport system substrate-binding protein